jgi:hypothetical protein
MDLRKIGWGGVDFIRVAQDRDQWRAVVNAGMNPWVLVPQCYLVKNKTDTKGSGHDLF